MGKSSPFFRTTCFLIATALVILSGAVLQPAYGQATGLDAMGFNSHGATTNYRFAEANELTIVVSILGAVKLPGRYEVSRSLDLMNLLALAGGTMDNADLNSIRIRRLYIAGDKTEWRDFYVDLEKPNDPHRGNIELQQGDFITITSRSPVTLQEIFSYITTAAVLTTAIYTVAHQNR